MCFLKDYQIQISQPGKRYVKALHGNWQATCFIPMCYCCHFAIVLAFIISLNLKPLEDFKAELTQRGSEGLAPIDGEEYPQELIPTIEEMNRLFERIQHAQTEQKQFYCRCST